VTTAGDPTRYLWWLASRASGIVALGLISTAVLIGLLMSTKSVRRPPLRRSLLRLHEHVALAGLVALAVHGITLLGDGWLRPGLAGIAVPFAIGYRPAFVAAGIVGSYLAMALGLSYYARRRIGARTWRRLHRATIVVWLLGVVHTLGAGSDAGTVWLRAIVLLTGIPIVYLTLVRVLAAIAPGPSPRRGRPALSPRDEAARAARAPSGPRTLQPIGEDAS
jgi:sulfoxide reductase heme-binding subunit YedZ